MEQRTRLGLEPRTGLGLDLEWKKRTRLGMEKNGTKD